MLLVFKLLNITMSTLYTMKKKSGGEEKTFIKKSLLLGLITLWTGEIINAGKYFGKRYYYKQL